MSVINDTSLLNEQKATFASRRSSIVAKVASHNIGSMDENRLSKIGAALILGSCSIIFVFDEVLEKESNHANKIKDHQVEINDLTKHVATKITQQLCAGRDVASRIVVDEQSGDISWTRTVVGDTIQVRDIVMSHNSLAVEEIITTTIPTSTGTNDNQNKETIETV